MKAILTTILFLPNLLVFGQFGDSPIASSCLQAGQIALSFDDGPSLYTGELLQILSKNDVKAAFHVKIDYLNNPVLLAYLRSAISDGHIVGLSVTAADLRGATAKDFIPWVDNISKKMTSATSSSYKLTYLRFPFMETGYPTDLVKALSDAGYVMTTFNLDSKDYAASGKLGQILQAFKDSLDPIVPPAKGAFISVQRDIVQQTVSETASIIKYLTDKGYKIMRLDACIGRGQIQPGFGGNNGGSSSPGPDSPGSPGSNNNNPQAANDAGFSPLSNPLISIPFLAAPFILL